MKYSIIENDIELIKKYDSIGVDRIFLDLEILGKKERQGHLDTVISVTHSIEDVRKISSVLHKSDLLVRINPIHSSSKNEIEKCINDGADIIMLPMFKTRLEVEKFVKLVKGRVKTCLLLETSEALARVDEILEVKGIDEVHVGLNDLHLSLGLDFMFEVLSGGLVEYLAKKIHSKNIDFGFGGVATLNDGLISGNMILKEHVRLKSSAVILSRTFKKIANESIEKFETEFLALKTTFHEYNKSLTEEELENNKKLLKESTIKIVKQKLN
ncbi:aldolase/citrate lyase family protein [Tenacibaculum amylolyticum]|uniref:aldolase/citrate lyase family protein n=1 Tax=Tenacibaculum amylolyticum TaxID=104269 RepID=UPI00389404B3